MAGAGGGPPAAGADGVIDRRARPQLYARFDQELNDLNRRLEPIERVRRFVLLARPFPPAVYTLTGPAKARRARPVFLETYAHRISRLYREEP
jgi:long-subunit acyl-CoA synthetase (AMP-forming)